MGRSYVDRLYFVTPGADAPGYEIKEEAMAQPAPGDIRTQGHRHPSDAKKKGRPEPSP